MLLMAENFRRIWPGSGPESVLIEEDSEPIPGADCLYCRTFSCRISPTDFRWYVPAAGLLSTCPGYVSFIGSQRVRTKSWR
jgi:hypothetical protein